MGAGAVGSYYGALLARAGCEVTLVARGAHLDALQSAGQVEVVEPDGTRWSAEIGATDSPHAADLVVITTKWHQTPEAAAVLAPAIDQVTPVVILQNGVDHVSRTRDVLGDGRTLGALAFVGCRIDDPGTVIHQAEGRVTIGDPAGGQTPLLRDAARILGAAWELVVVDDIEHAQWHKLLWNAGFNALCAVTGATAGEALRHPASGSLVREAMEEVISVAAARGIELSEDDLAEMLFPYPNLDGYHPSTAQDLARGRPLERAAIGGFITEEGTRLGVPTPVNRVLDALLQLQESRRAAA